MPSAARIHGLQRATLRYINEIQHPDAKSPAHWTDLVHPRLQDERRLFARLLEVLRRRSDVPPDVIDELRRELDADDPSLTEVKEAA